jgi:uncharacterized membrane protein YeaQ/YmgE (transglycosylase-associated protein family)
LLIGLFGSAVATAMMAQFETVLKAKITVAFFIPALVGAALFNRFVREDRVTATVGDTIQ